MANSFSVSRAQLIYSLCLPLAVLVGYFLGDPLQSGSMGVVVLVLALLTFPLLMKWYHPLLVFSCNAAFVFTFLPGSPPMWLLAAVIGVFFVLLGRCVDSRRRLVVGGTVAWSLLSLAAVAVLTALATGGTGLRVFGAATFGGKKYIYLMAGVAVYFVLANHQIPVSRAKLYAGLFFLSGSTALLSVLASVTGDRFPQLYYIIPPDMLATQGLSMFGEMNFGLVRISGLVGAASAICLILLARYGMSGILDMSKPWRLALAGGALGLGLLSGFRSFFGLMLLIFAIAFFLEGLHRTRYLFRVLGVGGAFCGALVLFSDRLPFTVQRSLSFLPVQISPLARQDAQGSWEWRFGMWKDLMPDVPRYLFKGKGYRLDPSDMMFARFGLSRSMGTGSDPLAVAGDYHNGPLSVLIPFGIWGALAFVWFLLAAGRMLHHHFVYGDPNLRTINCALLACFIARAIFFVFLVGALETDLVYFASLAGLSLSLNGAAREHQEIPQLEPIPQFST
jgi:hypothetical protein